MAIADKYYLSVTAGSTYSKHENVPVNTAKSIQFDTPDGIVRVQVKIQDFRPPPNSDLPPTSPYFQHETRKGIRYSISFSLTPKRTLSANDLVFGNDFDAPIRPYLPPFFGTALHVVKTMIDPGLEGDAYADKPWLYGSLLSSVNVFRISGKNDTQKSDEDDKVWEEGAEGEDAAKLRQDNELPDKGPARMKWFLNKERRENFKLEEGRQYDFDFFNGYLDFNDFSLKLPMGVSFNVLRQMGDKETPPLRYVLRDRATDELLFHVTFKLNLHPGESDDNDSHTTTPEQENSAMGQKDTLPDTHEDDVD